MRILFSFLTILFLLAATSSAFAITPWQKLDDRPASAADFIDQETGLVAFQGPSNIITKFDSGTSTAVYATTDSIGSIIISDTGSAWAVIQGRKLLHATNRWTVWKEVYTSPTSIRLIYSSGGLLFFLENGNLRISGFPFGSTSTTGIPQNELTAIARLNDSTYFAASSTTIYKAGWGAKVWNIVMTGLRNVRSIYADGENNIVYVGGDTIMKSTDQGLHWQTLPPPPSIGRLTLDGQVYGVHDCTGTFYLSNGNEAGGNILRSTDLGQTLITAGRFPVSEDNIEKGWIFDRGSTFYWWDMNGVISVSRIGLDSLILQGIVPEFYVTGPDINATLCPDPLIAVPLEMHVTTCYNVQVDSVTVVSASGSFSTVFTPFIVDQNVKQIGVPYTTVKAGTEQVTLRVWYRMIDNPVKQSKDVTLQITTTGAPAALQLSDPLNFAKVTVDSSADRTITITNSGCDPLRVDSIVSTNPDLFTVAQTAYPFSLDNGRSRTISVKFQPSKSGQTIEALEIGTSAGHRFLEMSGEGVSEVLDVSRLTSKSGFRIGPNPTERTVTIWRDASEKVFAESSANRDYPVELYDALGRYIRSEKFEGKLTTFSIADLAQGEYFVHIDGQMLPLIIQR